ncbi:pirin family protein [Chitinophaga rhizophila]|uniref:Pirin family protein n=1 Tax=Chitinophaga rhizophila TaxID=2866212 RepID=A0ABS7G507_9BACT|nr:pirin family protein [Chitinophaga rhizophila]MBW8682733.1 pirin family protein [Chitinophaga rhizophila]
MKKNIAHILAGRAKNITPTETVLQPLPHADFRFANPFIVLHHGGPDVVPPGSDNRIHPHPHRGFAPVTFQLQGEAHHRDTEGNDQIIRGGDAQWMFAGKAILHSEGPSAQMHENGGTMEFLQLWVNVPAANKWDDPRYQFVSKEEMPLVYEQEGVHLRLVSGQLDGKTGPVNISFTPVTAAVGEIANGKEIEFNVTEDYWTLLYVAHGRVTIDDITPVPEHSLVVFDRKGTTFSVAANEDSQVLFLSAAVIDEPVAAKDNFVMNTKEEVDQAMEDYKNGRFGKLDY